VYVSCHLSLCVSFPLLSDFTIKILYPFSSLPYLLRALISSFVLILEVMDVNRYSQSVFGDGE
jgi:hypothetical protein